MVRGCKGILVPEEGYGQYLSIFKEGTCVLATFGTLSSRNTSLELDTIIKATNCHVNRFAVGIPKLVAH